MNMLVINGSPKSENSNTMRLTRAFLDGAGWSGAETVNIARSKIKPCLGCFACWNKTP
jgi:multimeric flavodoxin WrbA